MRHFNCKFTDEEEVVITNEYKAGSTMGYLAEKYQSKSNTIKRILGRQNTPIRSKTLFTNSEEAQIIHIYNAGHVPQKIADAYKVSRKAIKNVLVRNKILLRPLRRNFFNEHAFDNLDNEQSLYWLGFAYADGNVTRHELRFGLSIVDLSHLEKMNEFLGSNGKITIRSTSCSVGFASIHMAGRLKDLGIVVRRNEFYRLSPNIPDKLKHHFIRGYLDGDGCISTNEQVVFLGQPDILEWIRDTLHNEVGASLNTIRPRNGISEISWGGYNQARKIVDWLYKDATIFLGRKRLIADNWRK